MITIAETGEQIIDNIKAIQSTIPPEPAREFLENSKFGRSEKRSLYEQLISAEFPDAQEPLSDGAYVYSALSKRELCDVDFQQVLDPISPSFWRKTHVSFESVENAMTADQMRDMATVMVMEHKIHLMPKPEYKPFVLKRLLQLMKKDAQFHATISHFKVLIGETYPDGNGNMQPEIVIYPKLGKQAALNVLRSIVDLFADCQADVGTGITPRANLTVDENPLVYYAQGSFDYKGRYQDFKNRLFPGDDSVPTLDNDLLTLADGKPSVIELLHGTAQLDATAEQTEAEAAMDRLLVAKTLHDETYRNIKFALTNLEDDFYYSINIVWIRDMMETLLAKSGLSKIRIIELLTQEGLTIPQELLT